MTEFVKMPLMAKHAYDILTKWDRVFDVKNEGIQFIVEGAYNYTDYYPTTGKWVCRHTGIRGFGLQTLKVFLDIQTGTWTRDNLPNPYTTVPERKPE